MASFFYGKMYYYTVWGGGTMALSGLALYGIRSLGTVPSTMTPEWDAATEKYRRAQNMDPMGLGGREKYTPSYLMKEEHNAYVAKVKKQHDEWLQEINDKKQKEAEMEAAAEQAAKELAAAQEAEEKAAAEAAAKELEAKSESTEQAETVA